MTGAWKGKALARILFADDARGLIVAGKHTEPG